jgi:hypothetical protein
MKRIIKIFLTMILACLINQHVGFAFEDKGKDELSIFTTDNLNIGSIPAGAKRVFVNDEQVIKFVIKCQKDRRIRITKLKDTGNQFVKVNTEWKTGPITGFEFPFHEPGIYVSEQNTFIVTIKVLSIEVLSTSHSGIYKLDPEIAVEYVDN